MNYHAYLKSAKWGRIRGAILRRDKHRCRSCGGRAWQVHHGSYDDETMSGARLDHLFSLCGRCHEAVSLDIFGRKRPFEEQAKWTAALITKKQAAKQKRRTRRKRYRSVPAVLQCGTYRVAR